MLPQHPVGIVLENIIINYILLMIFNLISFIFYSIIITDVILRCCIGSWREMNQLLFLFHFIDIMYN